MKFYEIYEDTNCSISSGPCAYFVNLENAVDYIKANFSTDLDEHEAYKTCSNYIDREWIKTKVWDIRRQDYRPITHEEFVDSLLNGFHWFKDKGQTTLSLYVHETED